MSGIVGVWNTDGQPLARELLSRMSATLAHRGPDGESSWLEGAAGMACQISRVTPEAAAESQPCVHSSGTVAVFDGRLDNRDDLLSVLADEQGVSPSAPDSVLVLAAYHAFADRFTQHLNGDFALALFDPRRRKLLLARDAIGVRPLYYWSDGRTVAFASEIKALLVHPRVVAKPDDEVIAWFLLRQGAVDTEGATFFQGISRVQPGFVVSAGPEGCVPRRYWDFDLGQQVRLGSFDEYVEALRAYFAQAVRRRLRSAHPVAVSVSGGVDSSALFCVAKELRCQQPARIPDLRPISYLGSEGTPADEARYLDELERACAVHIERFPIPVGFQESSRESMWHVEFPLMDEMSNCGRELYGRVVRSGARCILSGLWGDQVMFDQAYLVTLFRRLHWSTVYRHLQTYAAWFPGAGMSYFASIFKQQLLRSCLPDPVAELVREFRAYLKPNGGAVPFYSRDFQRHARWQVFRPIRTREFASEHARSLYYMVRSGSSVLALEANNKISASSGVEMAFPFLDRDLIAFLMAIPGEVQCWEGVPKSLLRQAMYGIVPDAIRQRRDKGDGTDLANEAMTRASEELVGWLKSGMMLQRGYVKRDAADQVRALQDRDSGTDCTLTFGLSDLYGLELWLQTFCGEKGASQGHEKRNGVHDEQSYR